MTFRRYNALRRLTVMCECRCGSHLSPRRCSRERNPTGCDGVEDNKPSPQNRECAFTEISTSGDFYAFFRRHRSDARRKKLATMSPIGTESAKNLFCAHLGVSQNRLWRSWETRVCGRFHRAVFPLTFVRWFDPSEGRIFVVFLSNSFWQICRSAALEIVLILFDKFAVFGRSKNGVSSFSWYLRRTRHK